MAVCQADGVEQGAFEAGGEVLEGALVGGCLFGLQPTEQREGDQRHIVLDLHRILRPPPELFDLELLLQPSKDSSICQRSL